MSEDYDNFNWMMKSVLLDDTVSANSNVALIFLDEDNTVVGVSSNYTGGVVTSAFLQRLLAIAELGIVMREAQKNFFITRNKLEFDNATRCERDFDKLVYGFVTKGENDE